MTGNEIRERYACWYAAVRDPYPYQSDIVKGREEFDAWLAEHDQSVKAGAWAEGLTMGWDGAELSANPYERLS